MLQNRIQHKQFKTEGYLPNPKSVDDFILSEKFRTVLTMTRTIAVVRDFRRTIAFWILVPRTKDERGGLKEGRLDVLSVSVLYFCCPCCLYCYT